MIPMTPITELELNQFCLDCVREKQWTIKQATEAVLRCEDENCPFWCVRENDLPHQQIPARGPIPAWYKIDIPGYNWFDDSTEIGEPSETKVIIGSVTDKMWKVYELTHPDHQGLSVKKAAKEMGVLVCEVQRMLRAMRFFHPDLFIDIISDGRRFDRGVSRFGGWCEGDVVKKF